MPCVVADASSLSAFALVDRLDLVAVFCVEARLIIPSAVIEELRRWPNPPAAITSFLDDGGAFTVDETEDLRAIFEIQALLSSGADEADAHLGESACLALARSMTDEVKILIDDTGARSIATTKFGIEVVGSIGVLQHAARSGSIRPQEAVLLHRSMRQLGCRLPDPVHPIDFYEVNRS